MSRPSSYRGSTMVLALLLLLIAGTLLLGHGSSASTVREAPSQAAGHEVACYQGSVRLAGEGAIAFEARCDPRRRGERVGIELTVGGKVPNRIEHFQRHLVVVEGPTTTRRGFCRRDRHAPPTHLVCQLRADRSARITGRIRVAKGDGCQSNVALTSSPKVGPCDGSCGTSYVAVVLAEGPPRGC